MRRPRPFHTTFRLSSEAVVQVLFTVALVPAPDLKWANTWQPGSGEVVSKLFLGRVTRGWGLGKSWENPSPEPQATSPHFRSNLWRARLHPSSDVAAATQRRLPGDPVAIGSELEADARPLRAFLSATDAGTEDPTEQGANHSEGQGHRPSRGPSLATAVGDGQRSFN